MADLEKTTKEWKGDGCKVIETVTKSTTMSRKRSNGGWGSARLTFVGANLNAKAYADSTFYSATAAVSNSGLGRETHVFKVVTDKDCKCESAVVTLRCRAGGAITGFLKDEDMSASSGVQVSVAGEEHPIGLVLVAKTAESGATTEVGVNVAGKQDTTAGVSATAPVAPDVKGTVNAGKAVGVSGGVSAKKTWKEVRGSEGVDTLKAISKEVVGDASKKVLTVESVTSGAIAARNNDSTGDDCRIEAKITNEIETVDVSPKCKCKEKEEDTAKTGNTIKKDDEISKEQLKRVQKWIDDLMQSLNDMHCRQKKAKTPNPSKKAGLRLYSEVMRSGASVEQYRESKEIRPDWSEEDEGAAMEIARVGYAIHELEHEVTSMKMIAEHLEDGWRVVGDGMDEFQAVVEETFAIVASIDECY